MALFRNISTSFWTDSKVDDEFTPEDKYFFLYLLTNPHTNICGCYEISTKQMARETGYNEDTIDRLLKRMETVHNVIRYDRNTKEVLIIKWSKYNWNSSEKLSNAVLKYAAQIKSEPFKTLVQQLNDKTINITDIQNTVLAIESVIAIEKGIDTISIPYGCPIDMVSKEQKEQKKEKKPAALDVIISDYTENEELREALKAFVKFRKALSKGVLTERALNLNLNKLDTLADTDERKLAIVNQALERGWKSFYPLKEEPKEDNKPDMSKYDFVINNF